MPPTINTHTDLTFFTNEPGAALLDRFNETLKDVALFDVLVGYFRITGFHQLYESLEPVEKIRILVGLNVGGATHSALSTVRAQEARDFASDKKTRAHVSDRIVDEMESSDDSPAVDEGARHFIDFLQSGKLEIKAYPTSDLHAKVYISRFRKGDRDFGRVITGSSNFSESGFVAQREFNVELKDPHDVHFALNKFEELWKDAVPVTDDYIETLRHKTWLNDAITPYDLYLKFLFEYFQEDINLDLEDDVSFTPEEFLELEYQRQAVTSAYKILEAYNGVFIADVVGLGKTFVAALLAQRLGGRVLVICPPVLQSYWHDTFYDFGIRSFKVESLGKLEHIIRRGHERYDYVILDEAHRFRNELTQSYELLHEICWGKKVVLVSATPLNNRIDDILSLLKLFQRPKRSTIPGVPNLERFFGRLRGNLNKYDRNDPEYAAAALDASREMRDKVLKHVMVRRTRSEIERYFSDDLNERGLVFPQMADPQRIIYTFTNRVEEVFTRTIEQLKDVRYARYKPLLYLKTPDPQQRQAQHNLSGFMRGLLVKRLESSFHAFRQTLRRFIESYEAFIEMYENGTVYLGKNIDVFDLLDNDDDDAILKLVEEGRLQAYEAALFNERLAADLAGDLQVLKEIQREWRTVAEDPKLDAFVETLRTNGELKDEKLLVFTESKETGRYLMKALDNHFPGQVFFNYSGGGENSAERYSVTSAREKIKADFDPAARSPADDLRILITTDVLAEGVNLHRAHIVVNYDLPWNPTRVLQRVGRVNRVGAAHEQIHVYNFFPTAQSDEHLGLEKNITTKLQAFHDTLGEDARYLSDEEELSTHGLFGSHLYEKLADRETYDATEEGPSELRYLQLIRDLRDDDPEHFRRIKRLPKKARSCRRIEEGPSRVLTFFRQGELKKFYASAPGASTELTFFEAARLFECASDARRESLPADFYDLLARNKTALAHALDYAVDGERPKGSRNAQYILKRLKAKKVKNHPTFTDDDDAFLARARGAFQDGVVPKQTSKAIKQAIEKEQDPMKLLAALRKQLSPALLAFTLEERESAESKREVILSEYLLST